MPQSWRVYLAVIGAALCWLGVEFAVLPRLGDPVTFNKIFDTRSFAAAESGDQAPARNFRGNVYHLILDSYQSEAYQYFLEKTPELNQLPFTYYPNFRVSRPTTYLSLTELFSGDTYAPNLLTKYWNDAPFQNGMMAYLANAGVELGLYPYASGTCYRGPSTVCEPLDVVEGKMLGAGRVRQTAIDMWFLKLIPGSLKRELNARFAPKDTDAQTATDGDRFSDWDYGFSIFNAIAPSKTPTDADKPYFSVQQFLQFLDGEGARPPSGQYFFMHVVVPHAPFVLDGDCNYIGRTAQDAQVRYLQQVQCADKLVTLLVKKLESLGRLDNSLIIVQADHAYYYHPADLEVLLKYHPMNASVPRVFPEEADSSRWPSEMIEARASALLLIKFPGQSAASRSDKPVQMIDIAPTILRYFDIPRSPMQGIPVQDMPEALVRDRLFFATSKGVFSASNFKVFSKYRYVDGTWKFEENIQTLTDVTNSMDDSQ